MVSRAARRFWKGGTEHDDAQRLLRAKYPQYRAMDLAPLPVIAIRIERVTSWSAAGGGGARDATGGAPQ